MLEQKQVLSTRFTVNKFKNRYSFRADPYLLIRNIEADNLSTAFRIKELISARNSVRDVVQKLLTKGSLVIYDAKDKVFTVK